MLGRGLFVSASNLIYGYFQPLAISNLQLPCIFKFRNSSRKFAAVIIDNPAVPIAESMRRAFDAMIQEARGELHEHEQHVTDCHARLNNLLTLRAALDVAPNPENDL